MIKFIKSKIIPFILLLSSYQALAQSQSIFLRVDNVNLGADNAVVICSGALSGGNDCFTKKLPQFLGVVKQIKSTRALDGSHPSWMTFSNRFVGLCATNAESHELSCVRLKKPISLLFAKKALNGEVVNNSEIVKIASSEMSKIFSAIEPHCAGNWRSKNCSC